MNFASDLALSAAAKMPEITFELGNFVKILRYMGMGMLVIFVVIGVIILSVSLINYLFSE